MDTLTTPPLTASSARTAARRHLHSREVVRSTGCEVQDHPRGGFLVTVTTPQGARLFHVTCPGQDVRVVEEE